jgi:hypothetical protein
MYTCFVQDWFITWHWLTATYGCSNDLKGICLFSLYSFIFHLNSYTMKQTKICWFQWYIIFQCVNILMKIYVDNMKHFLQTHRCKINSIIGAWNMVCIYFSNIDVEIDINKTNKYRAANITWLSILRYWCLEFYVLRCFSIWTA